MAHELSLQRFYRRCFVAGAALAVLAVARVGAADDATPVCRADGPGLRAVTLGQTGTFGIVCDRALPWRFAVEHSDRKSLQGFNCSGAAGTTFQCSYLPAVAGDLTFSITASSPTTGPILVSPEPITVAVTRGPAVAALSKASGEGLVSATSGTLASFVIQAYDQLGRQSAGGEPFVAALTTDEDEPRMALLSDRGDGSYQAQYLAPAPGTFKLAVTLRGLHIAGSPYTVTVLPGANAPAAIAPAAAIDSAPAATGGATTAY